MRSREHRPVPPTCREAGRYEVTVTARCTDHCQQARVIVRDPALGSLVVADQTVAVDFSQAGSAPDELNGVISLRFTLIPLSKRCGDQLQVQVTCSQDQAATKTIAINCKPPPPNIGWNWCRLWVLLAAGTLFPALILIATGVGMQQFGLLVAALVMIGIAGGLWALWMIVCSPDICTRLGVLCWVFKASLHRVAIRAATFVKRSNRPDPDRLRLSSRASCPYAAQSKLCGAVCSAAPHPTSNLIPQ